MQRPKYLKKIQQYFRNHPVVAILGPRQCGKTTLARMHSDTPLAHENYFDLDNPLDLARLSQPMLALNPLQGLIIIDEVQNSPDLFSILRVIVDQIGDYTTNKKQFLILGSASRELLRQSSETLAGRIAYIELPPFSFEETGNMNDLWLRGGFPKSYLAQTLSDSVQWREFYITTFLEQDIPRLGINIPPQTLRRFWSMIAHYHANILNTSELARAFGVSDTTIRRYLDILTGTFMIRQLQPWFVNISKRQVKAPKIYFRDSGLFHSLIQTQDLASLQKHPKVGASWEGFALEEIIRGLDAKQHEVFFWATHSGAELDLLIIRQNKKYGFEFKYSDAPTMSKSLITSLEDLELDQLFIIYPGEKEYKLHEKIIVTSLKNCFTHIKTTDL